MNGDISYDEIKEMVYKAISEYFSENDVYVLTESDYDRAKHLMKRELFKIIKIKKVQPGSNPSDE